MKKILGIALFLCLTAPFLTCLLYLQHQTKQVRKEVKHRIIAGIGKEELVLLKFTQQESKTELLWKHSKEFEYRGQMYDIVEEDKKGDTIYYWCWWDYKETKLNQQLTAMVTYILGKNQERSKHTDRVITFYKSLFCSTTIPGWNIFIPEFNELYYKRVIHLDPISYPPPQPPPEKD